ncbi:hypothetical protein ACFLYL_03930 [Chloroflexota bacterium]
MALDEPNKNEAATHINGIDILISDEVKALADKGTIDYMNSPDGEGFTIAVEGQTCC